MNINNLKNNVFNNTVTAFPNVSFKGKKNAETPKVDLTQKPDTVSFSSKRPKPQDEVFAEIENYVTKLPLKNFPVETAMKEIVKMISVAEKNGSKINEKELADTFRKIAENPLKGRIPLADSILGYKFQAQSRHYLMQRNLISMANIIEKTPRKENETASAYLKRVNSLNSKRTKQLEKGRISVIKAKLDYKPERKIEKETPIELEPYARQELIDTINWEIEASDLGCEKLKDNATMEEITNAWQCVYVCDMDIPSDNSALENGVLAVLQNLGRYDSSNPPKTKDFGSVFVVDKDYKSEFKYEPVYRWLHISNPNEFVKNFPKNGEIYSYSKFQSCSTNKKFAEDDFNDERVDLNVKFVLHPKSQTSKAYTTGIGQEVVYPPNTKFKVLDKTLVEDVICPDDKSQKPYSVCRWEIHMQEV